MRKIKNYNNFFISGCCGTVGEALLSHIVKNIKFSIKNYSEIIVKK